MSDQRPRVSAATYTFLTEHAERHGLTIGQACDDLVARARRRFESISSYERKRKARKLETIALQEIQIANDWTMDEGYELYAYAKATIDGRATGWVRCAGSARIYHAFHKNELLLETQVLAEAQAAVVMACEVAS